MPGDGFVHFSDRDVEALAELVFHGANDLATVFEGLGVFNAELESEMGDGHGFAASCGGQRRGIPWVWLSGVLHSNVETRVREMFCALAGWSPQEREGYDGFAGIVDLFEQFFFEFVRGMHLGVGDLVVCCSDKAEFAAGKAIAFGDTHRRTEDAAGHGTEGVDVAKAGLRVEGGTGRVVGEVFEAGLVRFGSAEDAG